MKIDLDFIIDTIQSKTNLDINKNTRERVYVYARALYYKLAKEYTFNSLQVIADKFGKNHATVLHGLKVFEEIRIYNKEMYRLYEDFHTRYPVELINKDGDEVLMTDREKSIVEKFNDMVEQIKAKDKEIERLNLQVDLLNNRGDRRSNIMNLVSKVPEDNLQIFEERISAIVNMIK